MNEEQLVRNGIKQLPFDIYAAMRSRRDMFGTENPHTFDYVYDDQEHYRVVLEFRHDEVEPGQYILRDLTHIEYAAELGQETRRFAVYDADHTCIVNTLNEGNKPMMVIDCAMVWADRDERMRITKIDVGLAFTVSNDTYTIETRFVLSDEEIADNPHMGDPDYLHEYMMVRLDQALFDRLPTCCGNYVAKTLRGEGKTRLSEIMKISTNQSTARQTSEKLWGDILMRGAHPIKLDFEPIPTKRKRRIDLWGTG